MLSYYTKTNYNKYGNKNEVNNNNKIINNLNRVTLCLILFNSILFKYNIFSTIELKIFFDKNKKIINVVYFILILYSLVFILFKTFNCFRKKNRKKV
jgi:hypothetical protein